jgi:hypothetical protein
MTGTIKKTGMMTDNNQLHQDFLRDFTELLQLYNAEFEMMEGIPEVFFNGVWNEDGDTIRPQSNFNLPNYVNPN